MRSSTLSGLAVMASSLLVKEVFAGPIRMRDLYVDTDSVIVSEEVVVTANADGSLVTGAPEAVGTLTIDGSPVLVTETPSATQAPATQAPPTSATPVSTSSTIEAAAFIQQPSSTPVAVSTTSTPVYVAPTTSASPTTLQTVASTSSTAAASTSTSTSGKRGAAYNDASLLSVFAGMSEVTWAYNWASSTSDLPTSVSLEYVPMLWGLDSTSTDTWSARASSAISSGSSHLLSFNEPDLAAQANLGYADAAAGYLTYMQPFASQAKLGSPAVTNGGSPMGLTWLSNFISSCSTCTIDFVAIHWYNGGDAEAFKTYIADAYTAGGNRPVWITEFQASGTTDEQNAFLEEIIPWLDEQSYVERYAYFMVADGTLLSGTTALSTIGTTYAETT